MFKKRSLHSGTRNTAGQWLVLSSALVLIVASLVALSALSMESLSALRAYVNGEALWSKAEKDAVLFLNRYGNSRLEADFERYRAAIQVPLGDHVARLELQKPSFDRRVAQNGFLQGRNHPEDVDRMIWLFRKFGRVGYVRNAIGIWEQGDVRIEQLQTLGTRLHQEIFSGATPEGIDWTLGEINRVNEATTPLEDSFSQTLGEGARWAQGLFLSLLLGGGTILVGAGCVTCFRLLKRIQESERKYRRLIETASEAIFISDGSTGEMLESNRKAEEMLGAPAGQFLGTTQPLLPVGERDGGHWEELVASLTESNGLNHEMRLRRPDGRIVPVEVSANVVRIGGRKVVQSIIRDIGDRKAAEKALHAARDKALEASRTKGQFLANMSHEIRTPMNGVLGMMNVLEGTDLTEEQQECVSVAKDSAESLLTIINDILDFSRIEAGRLKIDTEAFSPSDVANRVIEMLRARAEEKGLRLIGHVDRSVPGRVVGDPARLRQILTNLIMNAVKFTERGSVTLNVLNHRSSDSIDYIRYEVRDTGIGISPDAQLRLFEAFSQADASITRRFGGTGLGLAISRQLVHLMGGEIGVWSEPDSGSTFWFQLPRNASQGLPQARIDRVLHQ